MGATQTTFLLEFGDAFRQSFHDEVTWAGGQARGNTGSLLSHQAQRRGDRYHSAERFELGDLTTVLRDHKIIIEYESKQVSISNLLKYWPYLRGELSTKPNMPVLLCHFSDWWSYGIYRDLWQWTLCQIQQDASCLHRIDGGQFDHGGADVSLRRQSILDAISWLQAHVTRPNPTRSQALAEVRPNE